MELNTRVDHVEEELKLLKNEIKQVLLEVQEHVLSAQNPFVGQAPVIAPPPPPLPAATDPFAPTMPTKAFRRCST